MYFLYYAHKGLIINMKLIFKSDEFLKKFKSIKDLRKRFKWISELSHELDNIYRNFTDEQYAGLYKKYNLDSLNDIILKQTYFPTDNLRIQNSAFKYFILYLEEFFLSFVNSKMMSLKLELFYIERKKLIKEGKLTEEEKYPSYGYTYLRIKSYCDNVFPVLSDKIEYYDHIILKFKKEYKGKEFVLDYIDGYAIKKCIKTIKRELKSFKLRYELEKDKLLLGLKSNNKSSVQKKTSVLKKKTSIKKKSTNPKLLWLGEKQQLTKLLKGLQSFDFLENQIEQDPECEKLLIYFTDQNNDDYINKKFTKKIKWKKLNADLIYLYSKLVSGKTKLLDADHLWIKTERIFMNQYGKAMKHKNLSVSFDRLSGKERPILDEIISGLY